MHSNLSSRLIAKRQKHVLNNGDVSSLFLLRISKQLIRHSVTASEGQIGLFAPL